MRCLALQARYSCLFHADPPIHPSLLQSNPPSSTGSVLRFLFEPDRRTGWHFTSKGLLSLSPMELLRRSPPYHRSHFAAARTRCRPLRVAHAADLSFDPAFSAWRASPHVVHHRVVLLCIHRRIGLRIDPRPLRIIPADVVHTVDFVHLPPMIHRPRRGT